MNNFSAADYLATPINWGLLARAQAFYASKGFQYRETPWSVPTEINALTRPADTPAWFEHEFQGRTHELVASAEQGFLYQLKQHNLPPGMHQSISPCFRVEPLYGEYHQPWFMKLELCVVTEKDNAPAALRMVLQAAYGLYQSHCDAGSIVQTQVSDTQFDLELNGIEIGSYGIRKLDSCAFIYGTGLALPRFDIARKVSC